LLKHIFKLAPPRIIGGASVFFGIYVIIWIIDYNLYKGKKYVIVSKNFQRTLVATWKNKYLWLFGLFAALFGTSGDYEIISRFLTGDSGSFGWRTLTETNVMSLGTFRTISDFMTEDPMSFILTMFVGLFILVLVIFLVWLATVSQVALVSNAAALSAGKKSD
jgi:hypothetical protein